MARRDRPRHTEKGPVVRGPDGRPELKRDRTLREIAEFNRLLRRVVEAATKWRGLDDENAARLNQIIEVALKSDTLPTDLANALSTYQRTRGRISLDALLGPQKGGQGKSEFFAASEKLARDAQLMLHLHLYRLRDGLTVERAAKRTAEEKLALPVVHGRLVVQPRSRHFDDLPTASSLRNEYRRQNNGKSWEKILNGIIPVKSLKYQRKPKKDS